LECRYYEEKIIIHHLTCLLGKKGGWRISTLKPLMISLLKIKI